MRFRRCLRNFRRVYRLYGRPVRDEQQHVRALPRGDVQRDCALDRVLGLPYGYVQPRRFERLHGLRRTTVGS